ncbi:methylmalonic aciduria and homocystinuria type D homolog, mitochondrial-like isoform X2 [Limulus polyphemus]|uniref:Methylmalonic aciduria and homocystinuria type D homolog, mitochondrial-like isoform X2 n=1 Tax=Limulus polyphemus TaxID=6850 RepID=A0ABM1S1W0_LIMPO|nr:methylmalonic aciduria and homocystinuria type D homolog, mitochondrial-like isoform X2 [Limulus polyphemus]XP_022237615.1 methylmalonic aciduria and homocystinuria type D homolog, mitochondrial-like isoform X2 [Limulus polyphemus]
MNLVRYWYCGQKKLEKQIPDREISLVEPKDFRTPLPGDVGVAPPNFYSRACETQTTAKTEPFKVCDVLTRELAEDRHHNVIFQFLNLRADEQELFPISSQYANKPAAEVLECIAYDCPALLRKDFQDLFPGHEFPHDNLTVLTICQRTKNDMTIWSEDVELEQEELKQYFMNVAHDICKVLREAGYWADIIDPSSGKFYHGPCTNATLFETNERYRHFGFTIEDLGCCKMISHHIWGTHAFVGCLFTNAPLKSPEIEDILQKQEKLDSSN